MAARVFTIVHQLQNLLFPSNASSLACSSSTIPYPTLPGAQFLSLYATEVKNYAIFSPGGSQSALPTNLEGLHFCNVSLAYTHPGQGDYINVQVWLPIDSWNSRFMGTGGGGYATGMFDTALSLAVSQGYSAAGTDGGHPNSPTAGFSASEWALISPNNVNLYLLQDFASVALNDMAIIGKAVTESFYSAAPKFSYWNGCSTGGRQGLMMAQRYPGAYNGILAAAPAINWAKFVVAGYWAQFVMNQLGSYPSECEISAITFEAIAACDGLDGLVDGILAAPGLCNFDPSSTIGKEVSCPNGNIIKISASAAKIVEAAWAGGRSSTGQALWYGSTRGTNLNALTATECHSNGTCFGRPFQIAVDWIRLFIKKDPNFDVSTITHKDFDNIYHKSVQEFSSFISTDDPDLSEFRDMRGKMITWHGLSDELIPVNGTSDYYERVQELDADVRDYYRYFEAPGAGHCSAGVGAAPYRALEALVRWVEHGEPPDTLAAQSLPDKDGKVRDINLCPYPQVPAYQGGDPANASSFECKASF